MQTLQSFRTLYHALSTYAGNALYADILEPNVYGAKALLAQFRGLRTLAESPPKRAHPDALCEFFALSVINDALLTPLKLSKSDYLNFFHALGFEPFEKPEEFNPLLCEIVEVENWPEPERGVSMDRTWWPGLRFGELIFSRCGVTVTCNKSHGIVDGVANRSVLHFTNHRMHRPTNDLSHGWGSCSRWRTDFHRTYIVKNIALINVDGDHDLASYHGEALEELSLEQARELLLHRGFVQTNAQEHYFPYDWKMAIKNDGLLWPLRDSHILPFDEAVLQLGIGQDKRG